MTKARDQWREMMTARLFGELTEGEGRRLDHLLASNEQAQIEWAELTEAHEALRAQSRPEATPGLADRLLERLMPALDESADAVGTIAAAQGGVERCAEGTESWAPAQAGVALLPGDSLRVSTGARALVRLPDRSELWINAGSLLRFAKRRAGDAVKLISGEMLAFMEKRDEAFQIATPHGRIAVVGTVFSTAVHAERGSAVSVVEGAVRVIAGHAERLISGGTRQRFDSSGLARREPIRRRERLRLEEWTQPLLASASSSHRLSVGDDETGGMRRLLFPSLIGALLILMIGYAVTRGMGSDEPPDTQTAFQSVQAQMASATPLDSASASPLSSPLTAGMTWPSTTHIEGELFVQRSSSVDLRVRFGIRLDGTDQVTGAGSDGTVTIDRFIDDAIVHVLESSGPRDEAPPVGSRGTELETLLENIIVRETHGPEGVSTQFRLADPDLAREADNSPEGEFFTLLLTEPHWQRGLAGRAEGETWTDPLPVHFMEDAGLQRRHEAGALAMFGETPARRVVSRMHQSSDVPREWATGPLQLLRRWQSEQEVAMTLNAFTVDQQTEAYHRADDGRLMLSSTEFFHSHSLRLVPTHSDERLVRVNRTARLTLRAVTQADFPEAP